MSNPTMIARALADRRAADRAVAEEAGMFVIAQQAMRTEQQRADSNSGIIGRMLPCATSEHAAAAAAFAVVALSWLDGLSTMDELLIAEAACLRGGVPRAYMHAAIDPDRRAEWFQRRR